MFNKVKETSFTEGSDSPNDRSNRNPIEDLFNKKVQINISPDAKTPPHSDFFQSDRWSVRQFQVLKSKLNFHKSQLNDFPIEIWSKHTRQQNPSGEVLWRLRQCIKPEFLTQAWTKFYEIAFTYDIVSYAIKNCNKLVSLHLCEAPGAFVASLNHYLQCNHQNIEWQWLATTLNPYYEGNSPSSMITDDRFMLHTLQNWDFGEDGTGNIMDWDNSQHIIKKAKSLGEVFLVTADGSIDCLEKPDEQELVVSSLHYCEVVTALQALHKGGVFVWKIFTFFEDTTINLLYLISTVFEEVHLYKPSTSKQGNSEVYTVCLDFKGLDDDSILGKLKQGYGTPLFDRKSLFNRKSISEDFMKQIEKCSHYFTQMQCSIIDNNIIAFKTNNKFNLNNKELRTIVASEFLQRYNIKRLKSEQEILKGLMHQEVAVNMNPRLHVGSYSKRISFFNKTAAEQLDELNQEFSSLSKSFQFFSTCNELIWHNYHDSNRSIDMSFFIGKPVENLKSSQFIFLHLLRFYRKLENNVTGVQNEFVFVEIQSKLESLLCQDRCSYLYLNDMDGNTTYDCWEKNNLNQVYETLQKLSLGYTLVIINMNLLSHLNVGILFMLAHKCFERVGFFNGQALILQNMNSQDEIRGFFNEIFLKINEQKLLKKTVLRILPVETTRSGDLYEKIIVYNNSMYRLKSASILRYLQNNKN